MKKIEFFNWLNESAKKHKKLIKELAKIK